jgi:hypothetical protein
LSWRWLIIMDPQFVILLGVYGDFYDKDGRILPLGILSSPVYYPCFVLLLSLKFLFSFQKFILLCKTMKWILLYFDSLHLLNQYLICTFNIFCSWIKQLAFNCQQKLSWLLRFWKFPHHMAEDWTCQSTWYSFFS